MRVIVTGHAGLEKREFLQQVVDFCAGKGQRVVVHDLEQSMLQLHRGLRSPFHLQQPHYVLADLRRRAFQRIIDRLAEETNVLVHLHATYRVLGVPFSIADIDQLKRFGPDMYVVLIDDVYRVKSRIMHWVERMRGRGYRLTAIERISLRELMDWRAEEILATKLLADNAGKNGNPAPCYIVARRHGPDIFHKLMFLSQEALGDEGKLKVYASFPISKLFREEYQELKAEVESFRNRLRSDPDLIVFDPWTIDERKLVRAIEADPGADPVRITDPDGTGDYRLPLDEVLDVVDHLVEHVSVRDWALIDQSDLVIAYRPEMSGGVRDEIAYASRTGKGVYAVWPREDGPPGDLESPHIDLLTETLDDLLREIKREAGSEEPQARKPAPSPAKSARKKKRGPKTKRSGRRSR